MGCGTPWALSAAGGWGELAGVSGKGGKPAPGPAPSWGLTGHEHQVVNGRKGTGGLPGSGSRLVENSAPPASRPPPGFTGAGHNTIFMEKADPQRFVIFCIHNRRHRKKAVTVDLLGECPPPRNRPRQGRANPCPSRQEPGGGGVGCHEATGEQDGDRVLDKQGRPTHTSAVHRSPLDL